MATVTIGVNRRLADCLNPAAAGFGVTATTSAGRPYPSVSHPWARRFYQAGFDGVRYGAARHPALAETAYALFGRAGEGAGYGTYADAAIPIALLQEAEATFGFVVL